MDSNNSSNSYTAQIKDKLVVFKHLGPSMVPSFENVTSVSAIPFTKDGKLVVVNLRHRGLDLPGGHVEPGEPKPVVTMNREVMEEACMTVKNPILADVIESNYYDDHPTYMLLYAVFVDKLLIFEPNDEASERLVIEPKDFIANYSSGDRGLMGSTISRAWNLLKANGHKP